MGLCPGAFTLPCGAMLHRCSSGGWLIWTRLRIIAGMLGLVWAAAVMSACIWRARLALLLTHPLFVAVTAKMNVIEDLRSNVSPNTHA